MLKYDKWFGEPVLIGLTGRYGHTNEKSQVMAKMLRRFE